MKKIKVGAVSYLNTKPLLFGIERSDELMKVIELVKDYPSKIAEQLINNEIDIGLVPVVVIPQLKTYNIVSDFCIAAEDNVASVCLFSDVNINNIEKVLLDYQSKTSVALLKVLLQHYWKKDVILEDAQKDFAEDIKGTTAGVLIGDRALKQRLKSKFIYDLAAAWKAMTGLPFIFAAWIANKKLPPDFLELFNKKNAEGVNNIDAVLQSVSCNFYDMRTYFTQNISYVLSDKKLKGMNLFLELYQNL